MRRIWPVAPCGRHRRQAGLTLLELMIAMGLSMGVIFMALSLLNTVKSSYLAIHDDTLVQDTGGYALEVIAQALRQANFIPYDDPALAGLDPASLTPGVSGLDNRRLLGNTPDISAAQINTSNHRSDVLAIRFFGSADQGMVNCAGFAVPPPGGATGGISHNAASYERQRGWSIFYIAADSTGTPELRCKYSTRDNGWNAAAVARGVEALHVLYGIGAHAVDESDNGSKLDDRIVEQYLPAGQMNAAQWRQVIAVRFAVLVRGEYATRSDVGRRIYRLFGAAYPDQSGDDGVVTLRDSDQPARPRKIFSMTVRLRNPGS